MASAEPSPASKKVLITGVSKGLGRALALELANRGHTIIGCSRNQTKLDSFREELSKSSSNDHLLFNLDVRSNSNVEELVRVVVEKNIVPDIIVNNAAVAKKGKTWEVSKEDFDDVIDTNVKGIANVLRHFIPLMISNQQGIIVNMSSSAGRGVYEQLGTYCASKWAVEGLSKSTAKDLPEGIAIVTLDPGFINTDMLVVCIDDLAAHYQSPEQWAPKAATVILDLTSADNGASLTINDPGNFPSSLKYSSNN